MPGIDLSVGGWDGWYFGSYGRAKMWRLIAPNEETYVPAEIMELRPLQLDVNYLNLRIKQLKAIARPALSPDDFHSLTCAVATLQDFLSLFASIGSYTVNHSRRAHVPLYAVETDRPVGDEGRRHPVTVPGTSVDQGSHAQLGPGKLVRNV